MPFGIDDVAMLLGGLGALGGAAGSIVGATQGGGGGGGGVMSTNPASIFLELIFGVSPHMNDDGSISLRPTSNKRRERLLGSEGLFGAEELAAIEDFMTPLGLSNLEEMAPQIAQQALGGLQGYNQFWTEALEPGLRELVSTGFLTPIDAVQAAAQRRFERETLPSIAEQFAGQAGTFGTDFLNTVTEAGTDLQTELGALEAELMEAAASRRATGLPVAQGIYERNVALPLTVAGDISRIGAGYRGAQESVRPGGRVLSLYSDLAGLGQPGMMGPAYQGFLPSSSTASLAALSQSIPQFAAALGDLWGQVGGGWDTSAIPEGTSYDPGYQETRW